MKKQLLIAAVAATMGTAAIADISITGNAKYKYTNADSDTAVSGTTGSVNSAAGEVNLVVDGSHGDTKIHVEQEFNMASVTDENTNLDMEDVWVSTKVGDFGIKLGAWDGSTTAITGDIMANSRSGTKVYVTTSVADVNLGYWTTPSETDLNDGFTVNTTIQGIKLELKESINSFTAVRASGTIAGVSISHENVDHETAGKDATLSSASYSTNGITFKADVLNGDTAAALGENDGRFIQYDEGAADGTQTDGGEITKISQISASMDLAGNTLTLAAAEGVENAGTKNSATKITVSRALAGGTNLIATYTDAEDDNAATETETFTAELNVKF
jgi:hypothetical protein